METRRAKWRRLAKPECTGAEGLGTYFGLLDLEARTEILRNLSTRPRHSRWRAFVSPRDAVLAFGEGHPLRGSARAALTSLHVHYGYAQVRDRIACGVQMARAAGTDDAFDELLAAQAARLKVLTCDFKYDYNFLSGAAYAHCRELRTLVLGFDHRKYDLVPVLEACGGVLLRLHLAYEPHLTAEHVDAIGEHCKALQELTLDHETTDGNLDALWYGLRKTLRRITMWPPRIRFGSSGSGSGGGTSNGTKGGENDVAAKTEAIGLHCTHLEDVEITRTGRKIPPATASMLYSLGKRLRVLRLMQKDAVPNTGELKCILEKCPNIQALHFNIQRANHVVPVLELDRVGSRLKELKLRHNFQVDERFKKVCDTMVNLEILTVLLHPSGADARSFIEAMFANPKPKLWKSILPRVYYKEPGSPSALPCLVNATGALRDVEIWVSQPCFGGDIEALLKQNPKLERLWIWNRIKSGSSSTVKAEVVRAAKSVIDTVVQMKGDVGELVIKDQYIKHIYGNISDACVPLRYSNIKMDVIVGSVRYVPVAEKLERKTIQY